MFVRCNIAKSVAVGACVRTKENQVNLLRGLGCGTPPYDGALMYSWKIWLWDLRSESAAAILHATEHVLLPGRDSDQVAVSLDSSIPERRRTTRVLDQARNMSNEMPPPATQHDQGGAGGKGRRGCYSIELTTRTSRR